MGLSTRGQFLLIAKNHVKWKGETSKHCHTRWKKCTWKTWISKDRTVDEKTTGHPEGMWKRKKTSTAELPSGFSRFELLRSWLFKTLQNFPCTHFVLREIDVVFVEWLSNQAAYIYIMNVSKGMRVSMRAGNRPDFLERVNASWKPVRTAHHFKNSTSCKSAMILLPLLPNPLVEKCLKTKQHTISVEDHK